MEWKPKAGIAIFLGIVLQPFTFLYLNRVTIFWLYLFLTLIVSIIDWQQETLYAVVFLVICPVHAYLVTKNYDSNRKRAWYSKWWGIPTIGISIFSLVFVIRSFFYEPFVFPSASMQPTIKRGDHIIVDKFGYQTYGSYGVTLLNKEISSTSIMQRGKLYAFYPPHKDVAWVKRLIAIPGDTIAVYDNEVFVNGTSLAMNFLYETEHARVFEQELDGTSFSIQHIKSRLSSNMDSLTVPESSYFFLGDNRDNSNDSRYWGFVTSDAIIGEVVYIFK